MKTSDILAKAKTHLWTGHWEIRLGCRFICHAVDRVKEARFYDCTYVRR
jgi:hypothetical protein